MLVEHFIEGSIPSFSVMYNIKILNTSNNTRIILSESFRHSVSPHDVFRGEAPALGAGSLNLRVSSGGPNPFGGGGLCPPAGGAAPQGVGGGHPFPLGGMPPRGSGAAPGYPDRQVGGLPSSAGESLSRSHRASKMLFQLTSGQLGFKGATRKSSFVVSKLIQQFFNFFKSRSDNFRNIQFNIFFVGINPKDGVLMDQIRLALPKLISSRFSYLRNGRGLQNFSNLPNSPLRLAVFSKRGPVGKFSDITPIPFNGCKLKKSRRK